jgi:hypothetical protein
MEEEAPLLPSNKGLVSSGDETPKSSKARTMMVGVFAVAALGAVGLKYNSKEVAPTTNLSTTVVTILSRQYSDYAGIGIP